MNNSCCDFLLSAQASLYPSLCAPTLWDDFMEEGMLAAACPIRIIFEPKQLFLDQWAWMN